MNFGQVHCDLDLGDMPLDQGHDSCIGHGQKLRNIQLYKWSVESFSPNKSVCYVCTFSTSRIMDSIIPIQTTSDKL